MKNWKWCLGSLVLSGVLATTAFAGDIVILHTNDTHCDIENGVGFAGVAAYKEQLETQGEQVILVDAGDFVQGDAVGALTQGQAIVDIMNAVGYDVVTLGNHEFDYKVPQMLYLMGEMEAEVVSSNFMDLQESKTVFEPYTMVTCGETQVAFVGITTPETFTKATPAYFMDGSGNLIYDFCQGNDGQDLYDAVQMSIDSALEDGAEYVVGLGHLGVDSASSPWRSLDVIANTTGMDVLIDGHSHSEISGQEVTNLDGEAVLLCQTGEKLNNLGQVTISEDGITAELISGEDFADKDEAVQTVVDAVNDQLAVTLEQVVATTEVELVAIDQETGAELVRCHETNLGDLVADCYRAAVGSDVALVNGGGIRANIPAGDITYADIIAVNPWGNDTVSVRVSGQTLLDALEMGASKTPEPLGGFLQVSGMTYAVNTAIPSSVVRDETGGFVSVEGAYRVFDVQVGGKPLDLEAMYTVGSHNYLLLSGGDGMTMFAGAEVVKDKVMVDNETIIQYIKENLQGVVGADYGDPDGQGRISLVDAAPEAVAPEETEPEEMIPTESVYVVQAGDNLWRIAYALYGDGTKWTEIFTANQETIGNSNLIWVGQILELP